MMVSLCFLSNFKTKVPGKLTYPVPVPISATAVRSLGIDG